MGHVVGIDKKILKDVLANLADNLQMLIILNSQGLWRQPLSLEDIVLCGSEDRDHQNFKIVDNSVCYNVYTLLITGNM